MRNTRRILLGGLIAALAFSVPGVASAAPDRAAPIPTGVTAGIAVYDRQTGTFTEQQNATTQFRSASVVKLLIALDFMWNRGPSYAISAGERAQLDAMLRRSDDDVASTLWANGGNGAIVQRMVSRLNLQNTAPPPVAQPEYWGYTAITPADTVRIYRYILDSAPAAVRDLIMGDLRQSTRCAADGFDQWFGIPSAFNKPWAVKQGWSGFGSQGSCTTALTTSRTASATTVGLDLTSKALHTTGTVGEGDRSIVAVFSLHPSGTSFSSASATLTALTKSLKVNGGAPIAGTSFGTWGNGVRVRAAATTTSSIVATLPAGATVVVSCQKRGEMVVIDQYRNDWWAYLPAYGGYMTNIYISSPENQLPGVPVC